LTVDNREVKKACLFTQTRLDGDLDVAAGLRGLMHQPGQRHRTAAPVTPFGRGQAADTAARSPRRPAALGVAELAGDSYRAGRNLS
jgi:hypothetical protein